METEAREALLAEQYDKIYRYCYMKTGHRQTAEDLTQETFLRFLQQRSYRDMGRQQAYLYTIARNLIADHYREKGRWPECRSLDLETAPEAYILLGGEETPGEPGQEEQVVQRMALQNILSRLSAEEREMVFLRYVNEVPAAEIGQMLGISRFAVQRRLRKMLKYLEAEWRKEEGE